MNKVSTLLCLTLLVINASSLKAQEKRLVSESEGKKISWQEIKERTKLSELPQSKNYPVDFENGPEFQKLFEPNGPYEYVYSNAELLDKRDATTKHFQNANGTVTAISSAGIVHYRKNNRWNTILNEIYPSNTFPGFSYANIYNAHQTYYGNTLQNGIKIVTENNDELRLMQNAGVYYIDGQMNELGSAGQMAGFVSGVKDEVITYNNLFNNVNATITQTSIGYELDYILGDIQWLNIPSGTQFISFREGLKLPAGYHAELEQNNQILTIKNNSGQALLKYKAPSFFEKNNEWGNSRITGQYHTQEKNGFLYVDVLVPASWLTDIQRIFPVVVDPTVIYNPNNTQFWTFQVDNDGGCDYNPQNDADDNIRAGFDDGTLDDDYFQGYAQYNISSIPDNACFQLAYARWFQYNFQNGSGGDDQLDFYLQPYDPITTDPSNPLYPCSNIDADIDNTATIFRRFNAFSTCGGACTQYPTANNQWKDFYQVDMKARVQASLPYDFYVVSVDKFNNNHADPIITDNDEWIDWRGHSNANRPQLWVTYESPYIAATSVTASPSTTVCAGTSVTLTRFNGTTGSAGNWAWYTGSTFLQYNNTSITVSPASTTTYCVRGENACGNTTCTPVTITVQSLSVAPTGISGITTICNGSSTTLTVTGGSLGTGATWNWYSGSCGGTFVGTGNSISVSPSSTTTYFVRAIGTCNTTGCASTTVTVNTLSTPAGSVNATATTICSGGSTQLTLSGGSLGTGGVWRWYTGGCGTGGSIGTGLSITVSPVTTTTYYVRAEGTCNSTTCASITVTVNQLSVAPTSISGISTICNGNSTTLSVTGGSLGTGANWQWYTASCGGASAGSGNSITVSPTSTTTYFVRAEGVCNTTLCASVTVTVNQLSTDPVSIAGISTICLGQSTTLSVQGGSLGSGASWQWFTGSCGGVSAGSGNSITVIPTSNTTYFVRAQGTCNTTSCASLSVTVQDTSRPATGINGITTICNGNSTTLSIAGGFLGAGANWQWYSSACGGTSVGSGTSVIVSPTVTTTYFARAEGTCNTTTCVQATVTVNQLSSAPTGISGNLTICEGLSTTLSAVGGTLGTGAAYNWYSGSCGGIALGTGNNLTVTPNATTDYYLRIEGTCNTTNCVFVTVTVNDTSEPASSVSGSPAICIGGNTNLAAVGGQLGVGAGWNWYTGSCGGTLISSGSPINVAPLVTTTYYLRAEGLCNTTICTPFIVNVNPLPNGSISGSVTLCSGFDTTLTFNFSTGAAPFDVIYTDGTNVFTKTGVNAGDTINELVSNTTTYSITQITDANGCVRSSGFLGSATITVAPLPVISNVVVSDVLCNGGNTGSINITVSSGTPAYQYSIDSGATLQAGNSFGSLFAGNYNLLVRDALNCQSAYAFNPVVVNEPAVLDHVSVPANASCDNVFDGAITVNVTGGSSPYTYSINGGPSQPGNVFSGLLTGTYNILVTDFNGCTDTSNVFIDTAYSVQGSIVSQTPVSCFGGADGTVTVQLTGGIVPYTYSINGVQFVPTPTFTGLASGNYVVTLRDSKGCTDFANVTIVQPAQLQAQIDSIKNIGCNGDSTGAIYISVSGGNVPYTYTWSNGAVTEDVTGLLAGIFNVAIIDSKGCSAAVGATISQPLPLFLNIASFQNVLCNSDSSGSIDLTVNGGVPPYSFAWSNGKTTEDVSALLAGAYSITVTDANGCEETITQSISEPTLLTASAAGTNVTCFNASNGSVDVTVTGGTTPYGFSWSNGAITEDLTNVSGGNYQVVITDDNNCTAITSATLTEPSAIVAQITSASILCNGDSTGSLDLSVNGGIAPYSYSWSNGLLSEDVSNAVAGTYSVTITDDNGCTATASAVINQPTPLSLVLAGATNVSCNGGNDGTIDLNVFGGTPLYGYSWSNGGTTEDQNALTDGTYSVTVTDNNGCTATFSATISQPSLITTSIIKTDVTCPGASNGSADLSVSGGVSPYTYLWSNGAATEDLSGVTGGTYTVIVTDANSCTAAGSIVISEGLPLSISGVVTEVLCNGSSTGAVNITVSGGNTPYTFAWSNAASTEDIAGVSAGTYTVTVNDVNLCSATASFIVTQPAALVLNATPQNVSCNGGGNGEIDITVQGGVFPYAFNWSNGTTTEDVSGLSGGSYSVTITDANLCTITAAYTINEPSAIVSSITATGVSCNGASDGTADLSVSGGTAPYTFLWSNFTGAEDAAGLSGGLYYVIISDANGCQHRDSVFINEPAPLALSVSITQISCFNSNDGAIDLSVSGGTAPYNYAWSNGVTSEDLSNLQNGVYVVTVTDANACSASAQVVIINPSVITANFVKNDPLCFGESNGSIDLIPSGGTPSYTFLWSNGASTEDISSLVAGTYIVTITDSKGCTRVDSSTLVEPQPLVTSGFIRHVSCNGFGDGFIDITAYGGTLPYAFAWSNGPSTEDVAQLVGGDYYVTVTDANNCTVASLYVILEPQPLTVNVVGTNVACFGGNSGSVAAVPSGGRTPYFYLWKNFETDSVVSNATAGTYTVQVTDSSGCFTYDSLTITEPTEIVISASLTDVLCFGAATGAIDITVSGGVGPYTFAWSNGAVTEDLSGVAAGVYTLGVTDANGCNKMATYTLQQGPQFSVNLAAIQPICNGGSTGSLTAIATGGAAPYTFNWSTGQSTIAISALDAGTYSITVTDTKSCTVSAGETLNEPAAIVVTTNAQGSRCFNTATGFVAVNVSGGAAPYTYLLNGVVQANDTFSNLLPGNYLVLVTDVNGCQGNASFTVASPSQISVDLTTAQQVILTNMQTQLVASAVSASPILNHYWEPAGIFDFDLCADADNCSNPLAAPLTTTTITVTVMNADSCYATDTLTIFVNNELSKFIPTAFTPNADGLNDTWEFDILGASTLEVSIFNRWGERFYYNPNQPNGITGSNGWDGTKNGKEVPNDTYVYKINVTYFDGVVRSVEGTVTVMR